MEIKGYSKEQLLTGNNLEVFSGFEALDIEGTLRDIYDFWMRQEAESVYMRFGCCRVPVMNEYQRLLNNAVVVVIAKDTEGSLIGYAEACRTPTNPDRVEFAVAVDEKHKRQGLAYKMMESLLGNCLSLEIAEIEAQVLHSNTPVLSLVKKLKEVLPIKTKYQEDYMEVKIDLGLIRDQSTK